MKRIPWVCLTVLWLSGCASVPSPSAIRSKYQDPASPTSERAKGSEIRDLILNASVTGKSVAERKAVLQRFEKALEQWAGKHGAMDVTFDLCAMEYHLFPNERKAALNLSAVYSAMRRTDESFALLKEALAKKDDLYVDEGHLQEARACRVLGGAYLSRNDAPAAIKSLEKAIELAPKDAHPHFLLGQAYGLQYRSSGSKADLAKGIAAFEKAFQIAPKLALPEDYGLYSTLLLLQQDHAKALDVLNSGINRFPQTSSFYFNLAQYTRANQDPVKAFYLYAMAELVSRQEERYGALAAQEREKIQAEADANKADPKYAEIQYVARALGEAPCGLQVAEAKPDAAPATPPAPRWDQAVIWLRKALEANHKNEFVIRFLLANALTGAAGYDEATTAYVGCVREKPWFAPAYVGLGQVYERKGDHRRAMELWVRAMETQPQNRRVQEIWSRVTEDAKRQAMEKVKEPAQHQ